MSMESVETEPSFSKSSSNYHCIYSDTPFMKFVDLFIIFTAVTNPCERRVTKLQLEKSIH